MEMFRNWAKGTTIIMEIKTMYNNLIAPRRGRRKNFKRNRFGQKTEPFFIPLFISLLDMR